MARATAGEWNGAAARGWLAHRVTAARADQATAERAGRAGQDDCDKATAEEMVCTLLGNDRATATREAMLGAVQALLDRDDYVWRGIHDDTRFDRHVRTLLKKLARMTKAAAGFTNLAHYQ
jgi:hypothetical protein